MELINREMAKDHAHSYQMIISILWIGHTDTIIQMLHKFINKKYEALLIERDDKCYDRFVIKMIDMSDKRWSADQHQQSAHMCH